MKRYEDDNYSDENFLKNDRDEEDDSYDSLIDRDYDSGFDFSDEDDDGWIDDDDGDEYEENGYSIDPFFDDDDDDDEDMYEDEEDEEFDFDF